MKSTLLLVGDVHLGRRPRRLPDDLEEWGLTPADLTPAAAWRAVVELALREQVDAVILAGDVVESDNARFEAFGKLEEGARKLAGAGICVYAVAGNHDVDTLPRLSDLIPDFRLLGRGGRWERVTLRSGGEPVAHLLGWSFPSSRFSSSPLEQAPPRAEPGDGLPRIGVMHCDVDGSGGSYAPVARAELDRAAVDGWFLGHVHKPSDLSSERPIGYLGSLVGLDPTETGPHGPWRLRVSDGGKLEVEQVPLAPLRWEEIAVDVGGMTDASEMTGLVEAGMRALHASLDRASEGHRAVGCRVRFEGMTSVHGSLRRESRRPESRDLRLAIDGVLYFVDRYIDRSRPPLDLERLAAADDPPALLARRLLALERGGDEAERLIRQARRELRRVLDEPYWARLDRSELDDDRVRELLIESGVEALEELLLQVKRPAVEEPAP